VEVGYSIKTAQSYPHIVIVHFLSGMWREKSSAKQQNSRKYKLELTKVWL